MIVVFKYKDKQYLIDKNYYIKTKNFGKEGFITISEVIMIYSKDGIEIGKPFIKKKLIIRSELINKKKQLSIKFKRRKRYMIRKGFKVEKYKLSLIKVENNG
ncbi:bL21 family ribosomal protein [Candidatus Vidania fulgoroideorum]